MCVLFLSCCFQVLEMLQRFKDSTIKREREVFNCMLRNLFEEYRFFPQYPDKELHITACLFGGIIEKGLVTYMALGLALRYVLEALRKPFGSKMYYFGIAALDRFKNRWVDRFPVKLLFFNMRAIITQVSASSYHAPSFMLTNPSNCEVEGEEVKTIQVIIVIR